MSFILLIFISFLYFSTKFSLAQTSRSTEDVCFDLLKEGAPTINLEVPFTNYAEFLENAKIYITTSNILGSNPPDVYSNWSVYMFGNDTTLSELSSIPNPKEKLIIFYYSPSEFEGCGGIVFHSGAIRYGINYTDILKDGKIFTKYIINKTMTTTQRYYGNMIFFISKESPKYEETKSLIERTSLLETIRRYSVFIILIVVIVVVIIVIVIIKRISIKRSQKIDNLKTEYKI